MASDCLWLHDHRHQLTILYLAIPYLAILYHTNWPTDHSIPYHTLSYHTNTTQVLNHNMPRHTTPADHSVHTKQNDQTSRTTWLCNAGQFGYRRGQLFGSVTVPPLALYHFTNHKHHLTLPTGLQWFHPLLDLLFKQQQDSIVGFCLNKVTWLVAFALGLD